MYAALIAMLRWGWRPGDFARLGAAERALVIAGLQKEAEILSNGR